MIQVIVTSLVLGLISSFHCVGMCGPLALALPVADQDKTSQVFSIALYNLGRILTYALLGLLFGLAGRKLYLAGMQQWFSIGAGILMFFLAFQYFVRKKNIQPKWMDRFHAVVQMLMQGALQTKGKLSYLFLGMANGLLPCGMVYLAIAGALNTTEVLHSVTFMAGFGAGTLPAMMALAIFSMRVDLSVRRQIKRFMPYVVACMAILLILRGLNLGIPFVSPYLGENVSEVSCH
jgi:uncharacterized protein